MKIAHVDHNYGLFRITADAYSRGEVKSDFELRLKVECDMLLEIRQWLCLTNNLNLKHALTSQYAVYYRAPSDHALYKLSQETIDNHLKPQLDFFRAAPIEIFIFHPHGTINYRTWRDAPWNALSPYCQQCGDLLHATERDGVHSNYPCYFCRECFTTIAKEGTDFVPGKGPHPWGHWGDQYVPLFDDLVWDERTAVHKCRICERYVPWVKYGNESTCTSCLASISTARGAWTGPEREPVVPTQEDTDAGGLMSQHVYMWPGSDDEVVGPPLPI